MEFEKQFDEGATEQCIKANIYSDVSNLKKIEYIMAHIRTLLKYEISQAIEEEREKMIKIIESMPDIARGEFDPEALSKSDLLAELERK